MPTIRNMVQYAAATALFVLGSLLAGAGSVLIKGLHVQPNPIVGAAISISGMEIVALSYLLVRSRQYEVAFRVGLYLVFGIITVGGVTSFVALAIIPQGVRWRLGLTSLISPQLAATAAVLLVAANLVRMYSRVGLGWKARGRGTAGREAQS